MAHRQGDLGLNHRNSVCSTAKWSFTKLVQIKVPNKYIEIYLKFFFITAMLRYLIFGITLCLVDLYEVCSNGDPGL